MNTILESILKARNGHYCHCVEVEDIYELETIAEAIISEWEYKATVDEIIEFLTTLQIYALNGDNEDEIYNFSFREYINDTLY